ncbi:MAG TPA: DUF4190 domain-containing protein [Clostridiaceae bacterium]|jgi:hypothetical protein|nr:DUF4190 domain-containing protein [Clostridiaceae bacterium]
MDENNINNNNTDNNLPNNEEVLNNNLASNDSTLNDNVTNNENTANTNTTTNMQSNEPNNGEEIKKEASAQEIVKKETVNVVQNNQPINNSKQNTNNMENDKKGFSIAALVLGIVAIVLSCIWYISIPCAILAIVFGILGIKSSKKGMSIAGITTGAIGMFICIAILIVLMIFGFAMGITDSITEIIEDEDYYDYYDSSYYFDYKDF